MDKVYLKIWLNKNLGDDLFLKIITDRYENKFYTRTILPYNKSNYEKNVKLIYINNYLYRIFNKIAFLNKSLNFIDKKFIDISDIILIVGGSIFMESKNKNRLLESNWYSKIKKKYYIVGSNIGPVYTQSYIDDLKYNVFKNAELVLLRDKISYDLVFDNNTKINYTNDIVFNLDVEKYKKIETEKKVIISVIDCYKKNSQMKNVDANKYEDLIVSAIHHFLEKGYEVELMSFCKYEGDEVAIKRIMKKCGKNKKISKFFYNGNIEAAIKNISTAEIIIGTRFHANILGFLLGKKVIPISYNDKTINMLKDLEFSGKYVDLNNLNEEVFNIFSEEININVCDIEKIRKSSIKNFEMLDKILVKR